jgi:hypothetical protein
MFDASGRRKMISLRLSEAEYEGLKRQYRSYGARSVSDLARLALQRILTESLVYENELAAKLLELDERVAELESHLASSLESKKATA